MRSVASMLASVKSFFYWVGAHIKNHLYLVACATIALSVTSYFVLPFISISAVTIGVAAAVSVILGPILEEILGWLGRKLGFNKIKPPSIASQNTHSISAAHINYSFNGKRNHAGLSQNTSPGIIYLTSAVFLVKRKVSRLCEYLH